MMIKCLICGRDFVPVQDTDDIAIDICEECAETQAELSNGKGEE